MTKAYYKKGEPIGLLDSSGFEILSGDKISDKHGRIFAVNQKGQAVSEGGQLYDIKNIEEPMVLNSAEPRKAKPLPEPEKKAPAKAAAPVLGIKKTARAISGHLVLSNVARSVGMSAPALAKLAKDAGIEVSVDKHNKRCISDADRERLSAIIEREKLEGIARMKPDAKPTQTCALADFSDQDLVDDLRRRGYTVKATITKTIEL